MGGRPLFFQAYCCDNMRGPCTIVVQYVPILDICWWGFCMRGPGTLTGTFLPRHSRLVHVVWALGASLKIMIKKAASYYAIHALLLHLSWYVFYCPRSIYGSTHVSLVTGCHLWYFG